MRVDRYKFSTKRSHRDVNVDIPNSMMCSPALQSEVISDKDWTLVWSDEFNGGNLDMTKWSCQVDTGSA